MASVKKFRYVICFIVLFAAVAFISPINDDWYYATAPNFSFTLSMLLPGAEFWRPLDTLFGAFMSFIPNAFPAFNRALVVLAHVLCAYILEKIMIRLNCKKSAAVFSAAFFLFSSAAAATLVSPDAINQAYSLLFGVLALYSYAFGKKYVCYIICSALSLLFKESGIVWMFIAPVFSFVFIDEKLSIKKFLISMIAPLCIVILYFICRFALLGEIRLGAEGGRYSVSVFSLNTVINMIRLTAVSVTGIDTTAVFSEPVNYPLAVITAALSAVFLLFILICIARLFKSKSEIIKILMLAAVILLVCAPHAVIGQAGEMHAYPSLFAAAMFFGYITGRCENTDRMFVVAAVCIFTAFLISNSHKYIKIYDYSARTQALTRQLREYYDNPEDSVLSIGVEVPKGYSVFDREAAAGAYGGLSLKQYYGYRNIKVDFIEAENMDKANEIIGRLGYKYDKIWIFKHDELTVIK